MPRPRAFTRSDVVSAAKEAFWDGGYATTGIADLERATGLSRSSVYLQFGDKRKLFEASIQDYLVTFVGPRLSGMESDTASLDGVVGYFDGLRRLFGQPSGQRGCLIVNMMAELGGHDITATRNGARLRSRMNRAFRNALEHAASRGQVERIRIKQRADLLTAAALGVWIMARVGPRSAAQVCAQITDEIESWRSAKWTTPRRS